MKFNWGTGIAIFLFAFIGFILTLVVKAHQTKSDLYAEDYYAQEVEYQSTIHAKSLGKPFQDDFTVNETLGLLSIDYPSWITPQHKANIRFYRPDNAAYDRTFSFPQTQGADFLLNRSEFVSGNYDIQINWTQDEQLHQVNKSILLSK